MKPKQAHATVNSAYGQDLDTEIKFTYEYQEYETFDEVPEEVVKRLSDPKAILAKANQSQAAAARAKKTNELLEAAGISKPTLEDPKVQFSQMVKALVASGKSQAEAEAISNQLLGTSF